MSVSHEGGLASESPMALLGSGPGLVSWLSGFRTLSLRRRCFWLDLGQFGGFGQSYF